MPKPKSSQLHKEIESYISEYTSNKFASEVPIGGGYADICFTREKIIFEINGPSHYENDGVTLNAHSRFRQRIMEKSGYRIYHIHYAHWDNAKSKDDFICDLLEAAGLLTNFQIKIKNTTTISLSPLTTFSLPVDQLKITIKIPSEYKSRKRERDEADASDEDKIRKYPKFDD